MDYGVLNLGSLALGLIAWIVPVRYMARRAAGGRRTGRPAVVSLGCCALSLWLQIWYSHHLVEIQDWSALLDTSGAVHKAAAVLLGITLLLNWMAQKAEQEEDA